MRLTSNSTKNTRKLEKRLKTKKSFSNKLVENADFYKPALNKIKTAHE